MNTTQMIRELLDLGWTQDEIAAETGVTQGTVSNHARGEVQRPAYDFVSCLKRLLRRARRTAQAAA